jgi:transposase InsO family protein
MDLRKEKYLAETKRRLLAVQICKEGGGTPEVRRAVAGGCGVNERTLRRWEERVREGKPVLKRPGRKPKKVPIEKRQQLIEEMIRLGPCAGVQALRGLLKDVPYRFITKMKRRFSRVVQHRYGWYRRRLKWLRAGAVWAMDFTKPKAGLWQGKRRLFLVRDLASGLQLAAVACRGETGKTVRAVLLALFLTLGAPLVLKHDNGGAFTADLTQTAMTENGVTPLASPTYWPQYNGSCERSGGTFKQRVEHLAMLAGHPGRWTQEDIEEAMLIANASARPRGANAATPGEAFEARTPATPEEREAFRRSVAAEIECGLETWRKETGKMATCSERAAITRKATQVALCEHGYLEFRRGRLSTPISTWKAALKA